MGVVVFLAVVFYVLNRLIVDFCIDSHSEICYF